jgi:hypothetical protein
MTYCSNVAQAEQSRQLYKAWHNTRLSVQSDVKCTTQFFQHSNTSMTSTTDENTAVKMIELVKRERYIEREGTRLSR